MGCPTWQENTGLGDCAKGKATHTNANDELANLSPNREASEKHVLKTSKD